MLEKAVDSNSVTVVGKIVTEKEFSHEMFGEGFYTFDLEVPRLSDSVDILPITISERLFTNLDLKRGEIVLVDGQLRSYNRYINDSNRLVLTIFARDIYVPEDEEKLDELLKKPTLLLPSIRPGRIHV